MTTIFFKMASDGNRVLKKPLKVNVKMAHIPCKNDETIQKYKRQEEVLPVITKGRSRGCGRGLAPPLAPYLWLIFVNSDYSITFTIHSCSTCNVYPNGCLALTKTQVFYKEGALNLAFYSFPRLRFLIDTAYCVYN